MKQEAFAFVVPKKFDKVCKSKKLSPRETEVAKMLVIGEAQKNIANSLGIALGTVEKHVRMIHFKLGFASTLECVIFFLK
ncbi:MAG TPA: helix-turn-helix transcriptional regulator [Verrucomicrobiae bacterium]|nr:helix-turn-helix transcriptional regulator [Verrucomicrobiae bacterium]